MESTTEAGIKPVRARNPRGEGGRLRGEIIAAAIELLDDSGDERAVTLRSVARRVGIAAPSIYPHFPDQPAIMFAVVQQEFTALVAGLRSSAETAGDSPSPRLRAMCDTYLEFAQSHPERYRTMFGGLWVPDLSSSSVTEMDMVTLGDSSIQVFVEALGDCVAAGASASKDVPADAVALWVGLHGLAHQRAVSPSFRWPDDIADRIINALAHLEGADA